MLELYNKISIFGERYGIPNDYESEILRESEIATTSTSNEIVGVSFGVTGDSEILREFEIATASSSSEIVEVESTLKHDIQKCNFCIFAVVPDLVNSGYICLL